MNSLAFVTPSFLPDLKRCELLVRSLDRFAPDIPHYLLIDRFEMPAFAHLASKRTILVPSEDVMGLKQFRLPLRQSYWIHPRTLPMRGWIRQQILKMAATATLEPETMVCLDSDVLFVRPFTPDMILEDSKKLSLLDVDYLDQSVEKWTGVAEGLLGLPLRSAARRGHVGHLITWSRDHMRALHERISTCTGLPWQIAVGRCRTFSEYILYGVFVREVLGYEQSLHDPSRKPLVRQPWGFDLSTPDGLRGFITQPEKENVAVMVHSKFGISTDAIAGIFDQMG